MKRSGHTGHVNDPNIIKWLESEDSWEWRCKAFFGRKQLLLLSVKEDVPNNLVRGYVADSLIAQIGVMPDDDFTDEFLVDFND